MIFRLLFKLLVLIIAFNSCSYSLSQSIVVKDIQSNVNTPFRIIKRTVIQNYKGDFDHFATDLESNRLFLAGEDGGSLEVFDIKNLTHITSIKGFEEPHAIFLDKKRNRMIVTDSGKSMTKILDLNSYKILGQINLIQGADVLAFDSSNENLWIVTGGKNSKPKLNQTTLSIYNLNLNKVIKDIVIDSDFVEGIAFEELGSRAFVNVSGKSSVFIFDKNKFNLLDQWNLAMGQKNSSIALDETNSRLFVVTREPFKFIVIDNKSGKEIVSFDLPKRTNELIFDKINKRIMALGDDYVATFSQKSANEYIELAHSLTSVGGKTGIFIPEISSLFVAISPGDRPAQAEIIKMTSH
jgi:hypothetical protein